MTLLNGPFSTLTDSVEVSDTSTDSPPAASPGGPPDQESRSKPQPDRQYPLTPIVLGALALIGGSAALVGAAGWADIHPAPFIAAGVAVFVGGLVARRSVGGGRGLIPLGLLMVLAVSVTAIAGPHLDHGTGDRNYHPRAFDELQDEYQFGIGDSTVDLRDVDFPAGTHTIAVDMGIGHTKVWMPADVNYVVVGDLEIGKIDIFGDADSGFGNRVEANGAFDDDATVVLDLDMEIGHAEVRRG